MDPRLPFAGYGAAALAYLILTALLAASARGRRAGRLLLLALLTESVWAASMALAMTRVEPSVAVLGVIEVLRVGTWFAFLIGLPSPATASAPQDPFWRARRAGVLGAAVLCIAVLALDLTGQSERLVYSMRVLLAIYGLLLLEQVYRNTPTAQRWGLKFLCIALLAMFGFDLAMYSDALLYGRLDLHWWAARGFTDLLLAPLIGVAASRSHSWKFDLTLSRQIAFHSATLLGAGLYLLAVATIGYYARFFGGGWGAVAQAVLLFAALIGMLVVGFSGQVRAWLRVTVAKNFFRYRYDYRREWLQFTDRLSLDHPDAPATESSAASNHAEQDLLGVRTIEAVATLVESNSGELWLRSADGSSYEPVAKWNTRDSGPEVPADSSLARFLAGRNWVVSVSEWRDAPSMYSGLELPAWCLEPGRVELIVPLALHAHLLGFIALGPTRTPLTLDWEVTDLLKTVGRQAASYLGQQQAVSALVQARQFESFNRMSAFVVHDLKNLVAQLSLMMGNAARHRDNPEFQADMLATVENVLERMRGLLLQLRVGAKPVEQPTALPAADVVRSAVATKRGLKPEPSIEIEQNAGALQVRAHRDRLERVFGHLIQNAAEATPPDGRIVMRLRRARGGALIEVQDTGRGMTEDFVRRRLFRPFESTKVHGMGIGTFESREYVRELGGSLDVESREGQGTTFRLWLPASDAPAADARDDSVARVA